VADTGVALWPIPATPTLTDARHPLRARHQVRARYPTSSRSEEQEIQTEIEFGRTVVGAQLGFQAADVNEIGVSETAQTQVEQHPGFLGVATISRNSSRRYPYSSAK
jgi:hypothetical protein